MTIATIISAKLCMPGQNSVTSVATIIAHPAQTMPLRAVAGELMALRPRMNTTATPT